MSIPEGTPHHWTQQRFAEGQDRQGGRGREDGHNLTLVVNSWEATVEGGDSPSIKLTADPSSVEVESGEGGAKQLGDKDKKDIKKTIDGKVLGSSQITFTSSEVTDSQAKGDLSIAGRSSDVTIPISVSGDKISGSTTLNQSDFGVKPFSTMMGALKVKNQVTVEFEGSL